MAFDLGQLIRNLVNQFNQGNTNTGSRSVDYGRAGQSASRGAQGINAGPNRPYSKQQMPNAPSRTNVSIGSLGSNISPAQPVLSYSPTPDYGYGMGGGKAEPEKKAMFDNPLLQAQNQNGGEQQGNNESENSYEYQRPDVETFTISKPIGGEQRTHDGTGRVSYTNTNKISEYTDNNTGERTTDITSRQVSGEQPNKQNRHPEMKAASMPIKDALSSYMASQQGNNMDKEARAKNPGMIPDMTVLGTPYDNPNVRSFNQAMEGLGLNSGGMRALNQAGISPEELAMAGAVSAPAISLSSPEKAYADTGEEEAPSSTETENNGQRIEGHASKNRTTGPSASAYSVDSDALQEADERNLEAVKNLVSDGSAQRSVDDRGRPIDQAIVNNINAQPRTILDPSVATWANAYKAGDLTKEQYDELYWDFINRGGDPYIDNPEYGNQANANGSNKKAGGSSSGESSTDNAGMSPEDYQNPGASSEENGEGYTGTSTLPQSRELSVQELWDAYTAENPYLLDTYSSLYDFMGNGTGEEWYNWTTSDIADPLYGFGDISMDDFLNTYYYPNKQMTLDQIIGSLGNEDWSRIVGSDPWVWEQMLSNAAKAGIGYAAGYGLPGAYEGDSDAFNQLIRNELSQAAFGALKNYGLDSGLSIDDLNGIWGDMYDVEIGAGPESEGYHYQNGTGYQNVEPNIISGGLYWDYDDLANYLGNAPDPSWIQAYIDQTTLDENNYNNQNIYQGKGWTNSGVGDLLGSVGLGYREV